MPKARSTVRPLMMRPDASPEEQAHARGLHEGMLRKVNRIRQEVATRESLARKLVKKIGLHKKRISELERELAGTVWTADYLASLLRASEGLVNATETFYGYSNLAEAWNAARDHLIEINYSPTGFPPDDLKAGKA